MREKRPVRGHPAEKLGSGLRLRMMRLNWCGRRFGHPFCSVVESDDEVEVTWTFGFQICYSMCNASCNRCNSGCNRVM